MPFLGLDWRSSGSQWVRTSTGWQTIGYISKQCQENDNRSSEVDVHNNSSNRDIPSVKSEIENSHKKRHKASNLARTQPYIIYSSNQKHGFISFSDAISRLDLKGAAQDIRRVNYVTKILFIVLKKISNLSGTSQKLVLDIVEAYFDEAIKTETDIALVKKILLCAHNSLKEGHRNHVGSKNLWSKHIQRVDKMIKTASDYQIKKRKEDGNITLSDLPLECLREIFLRISDHRDISRAGQTSMQLHQISEDLILWKRMCMYHFSREQMSTFLASNEVDTTTNWKYFYQRCCKAFGTKDNYSDMLSICCNCSKIFWKRLGHPCSNDEEAKVIKDLLPEDLISLLKL